MRVSARRELRLLELTCVCSGSCLHNRFPRYPRSFSTSNMKCQGTVSGMHALLVPRIAVFSPFVLPWAKFELTSFFTFAGVFLSLSVREYSHVGTFVTYPYHQVFFSVLSFLSNEHDTENHGHVHMAAPSFYLYFCTYHTCFCSFLCVSSFHPVFSEFPFLSSLCFSSALHLSFLVGILVAPLCVSPKAVPFGDGQHFVQLAGGTNDRTAPKLLELGLIGNYHQASKRPSLLHVFFFSSQTHRLQHVTQAYRAKSC